MANVIVFDTVVLTDINEPRLTTTSANTELAEADSDFINVFTIVAELAAVVETDL